MRIISKYHDYYDTAMAHGQDQSVVYNRISYEYTFNNNYNEIRFKKYPENADLNKIKNLINEINSCKKNKKYNRSYLEGSKIVGKNISLIFKTFDIIFCGKLYQGVEVNLINNKTPFDNNSEFFYDEESLINHLEKIQNSKEMKVKFLTKRFINEVKNSFEKSKEIDIDFLIENKITCVLYKHGFDKKLIINPILKNVRFMKVFDPFSCYQELDMFISGTLSYPQNFMVEIEDKYRIEQHGFDTKYGFRTRPHKK